MDQNLLAIHNIKSEQQFNNAASIYQNQAYPNNRTEIFLPENSLSSLKLGKYKAPNIQLQNYFSAQSDPANFNRKIE